MGCAATPNGGPTARIAASYLVSGYKDCAVYALVMFKNPSSTLTALTPISSTA